MKECPFSTSRLTWPALIWQLLLSLRASFHGRYFHYRAIQDTIDAESRQSLPNSRLTRHFIREGPTLAEEVPVLDTPPTGKHHIGQPKVRKGTCRSHRSMQDMRLSVTSHPSVHQVNLHQMPYRPHFAEKWLRKRAASLTEK